MPAEDDATMIAKVQAWGQRLLSWGQNRQSKNAEKLYSEAIILARRPEFYEKYGVTDDVDGRFDTLSLIVVLLMRRLKMSGDRGKNLSQDLFDSMFADMDLSLREMGAGDIGVSKRVRAMAEAFMGRLNSYVEAIDDNDRDKLSSALKRNLFRGNEMVNPLANGLVEYILELKSKIDEIPEQILLKGHLDISQKE